MFSTHRWARVAGFATGLAVVAALLVHWAVPRGTGTLGADVTFVAGPTGELEIASGAFVRGIAMRPGAEAVGSVAIRSRAGRTLVVSVRVLPSIEDLDSVMRVHVEASSRAIYDGTLGELRTWSSPFRLRSGHQATLSVRAWLPAGDETRSAGRIEDVSLAFRTQVVGDAA